ncbi:hypothetical protein JZ751_011226 [Albula glossodonta]|uniref:Uncharacterized protein n=1 Tax=Albula glossodonta TaxID=121402 RepID=A0A8T2NW28_9TELE|nr:hypothetical protein JZ751_011226 [Albula glossodonta]
MYYKLSGFTQRLTGSAPSTAYSPQGLKPTTPPPSTMIFATPTKVVSESGPVVEYMGTNKVPELQKLFQLPSGNNLWVHFKEIDIMARGPIGEATIGQPRRGFDTGSITIATSSGCLGTCGGTNRLYADYVFLRHRQCVIDGGHNSQDGVPVHLKKGLPDKLLYRTTMALTVGGTLYCLVALYMAANPPRK